MRTNKEGFLFFLGEGSLKGRKGAEKRVFGGDSID